VNTPTYDLVRDRKVIAEQITVDNIPAFCIYWKAEDGKLVHVGHEPLNDGLSELYVFEALKHFAKREHLELAA
jgi:hypothetical protein